MTPTARLEPRLNEDPPYWKGNPPPSQMPPPELPAGPRRDPGIPISRVEPPTVGTPDDLPPQD